MSTVLGIDLGTQSVKVVFYDCDARDTVAVRSAPLDLRQSDSGVAEQQAHWWTEALGCALQRIGKPVRDSVAAIGVSGQQHGFVPIDETGEVLGPVKLWCDTSTAEECEAITQAMGGTESCIAETGNPVLPGYTASKVRWFRDTHRSAYARMDGILLPHDYLNYYLTGERCMEAGDASGTGFFDVRNRRWSDKMLAAIDPGRDLLACLPEVRIVNEPVGALLPSVARTIGLPPSVPVSIGGGDNMMGAIGTGNVSNGILTVSLGTSGTVYAYSDSPVVDRSGNIAAFCSSTGGWLPLLCTMNCTVSTDLMRNLLSVDIVEFEANLARSEPGADGIITVPYFNGERTPNLPDAKACLFGMDSRNTRPENLLRSAVEGATFALRFGIDALRALGVAAERIVLTGGGARSKSWRQIIADVFNVPVTVLEIDEGAAMGAALQALAMLDGDHTDMRTVVEDHLVPDDARCCMPDPAIVETYAEKYGQYERAARAVAGLYSF